MAKTIGRLEAIRMIFNGEDGTRKLSNRELIDLNKDKKNFNELAELCAEELGKELIS